MRRKTEPVYSWRPHNKWRTSALMIQTNRSQAWWRQTGSQSELGVAACDRPSHAATALATHNLISCEPNLQSNLESLEINMGITDQQVRDAEEAVASKEAELKDLSDKMEIMKVRADRFILN